MIIASIMNEQMYNPRMMKPPSAPTSSPGTIPGVPPPNGQVNGYGYAPASIQNRPVGAPSQKVSNPGMNLPSGSSHSSGANSPNMMMYTPQNPATYPPSSGPKNILLPPQNSRYNPPRPLSQVANRSHDSSLNLLPPPYPNQYVASTPSPIQSPGQSAPQSAKSSRNPSPLPNTSYDMLEGQFQPNATSATPTSGQPVSQPSASSQLPNVGSYHPNAAQNAKVQPGPTNGQFTQPYNNLTRPSNATNAELYRQPNPIAGQYNYNALSANRFPGAQNIKVSGAQPVHSENISHPNTISSLASPNVPPHALNSSVSGPNSRPQHPQMLNYSQPSSLPPYSQPPSSGMMPPNPLSVPSSSLMPTSQPSNFNSIPNFASGPPQTRMATPGLNVNNQNQFRTSQSVPPQPSARPPQHGRYFGPTGGSGGIHPDHLASKVGSMNLYSGSEAFNIMQNKNVLPETPLPVPQPPIPDQQNNCSSEIIRCTLNSLPESQSLLQKVRLPLGILIHPFKDISNLPVIQCSVIVRCRSCRTYINPFVYFVDNKRWKCNLCYRVNELPEEFLFDPVSKQYGDPSRRPEVKVSTIEFIAPSEYMLRPPQPAVYLYLLDVTRNAIATGYLDIFCKTLLAEIDNIPGDGRTQIGFITFDSCIHFYNLSEGLAQPQMMIVSDIDDIFIPSPDSLLVNIHESKELVKDLLTRLPSMFEGSVETQNTLGAALQAAYKLMAPTGGRISVMQTTLPSIGPGLLKPREDPNQRAAKDIQNLGPANDFYKRLALDCSGQQIAVDLFILSSQYTDIATLSCVSKFSGGCIYYYPGFQVSANPSLSIRYKNDLQRYITRKIGFEAVMRIRCTKGISIHTFHGNFFVRSTDLLSLPNINPDAAFGMHMSLEESLSDCKTVCFQAALLYTSTAGERRIRVHTLCLPVTNSISDVISNADQQAIAALVAKMAVDRSLSSSMSDAREALVNVPVDACGAFQQITSSQPGGALMVPVSLRLLPLYVLAILKSHSFRVGTSTKLDERVFAMNQLKTLPLNQLILSVYPEMYPVHALGNCPKVDFEGSELAQPPLLHLSSERTDRHGAYLMNIGRAMYLYVCSAISDSFCQNVLGVPCFAAISEEMLHLPERENTDSKTIRTFIKYLNSKRRVYSTFRVIKDDSRLKLLFLEYIVEDRSESTYSYYEFLQHVQQQVCK